MVVSEFTITPAESDDINHEIADDAAERLKETLRSIHDNGGFNMKVGSSSQQLAGYMAGTLGGDVYLQTGRITDDLALLLSEDYVERRKTGEAPELRAEVIARAVLEMNAVNMQAEAQGMPGPFVEIPEYPKMWPLIFQMPDYVAGWEISDMWRLIRERDKKAREQVT